MSCDPHHRSLCLYPLLRNLKGEEHFVIEAINRQMTRYAAHAGQIVLLAKHYAGPNWQSLGQIQGVRRGEKRHYV